MKLSQFSKGEPSKVMPDISWMFGVWSTHSNVSSPILQVLKIAFQPLAHTISNNTTISEIGLNYSSVYVQTNKKRYPPKNGPEKTCQTTNNQLFLRENNQWKLMCYCWSHQYYRIDTLGRPYWCSRLQKNI